MVTLKPLNNWHDTFLALLESGTPFANACMQAMIPATKVYNDMGLDPQFKTQVENAQRRGRGEGGEREEVGGRITGAKTISVRA